jgi:acyl dehydratase
MGWWDDVEVGAAVPAQTLPITYEIVAGLIESTGDHFPGHHDPVYAKAQGNDTIYLNTMFVAGFFDRVVTDWAGPDAFIRRRRFRMMRSVCAGEVLTGKGAVTGKRVDDKGFRSVDVEIRLDTEKGPFCAGQISVTRDPWFSPGSTRGA